MMICLANEAWAELMKEKMKVEFEKVGKERMENAAKLTVEHNIEHWMAKMA